VLYDRSVPDENGAESVRSLLFAWSPAGYRLRELDGAAPEVGTELDDDGHRLLIVKVGPSPLPGDRRRCAYSVGA
jgi:hypothetical protein